MHYNEEKLRNRFYFSLSYWELFCRIFSFGFCFFSSKFDGSIHSRCFLHFFPILFVFLSQLVCISSHFCLYFFPIWGGGLPKMQTWWIFSLPLGGNPRSPDNQIPDSWNWFLRRRFPQHGAALAHSSLSQGNPMMSNPKYCRKLKEKKLDLSKVDAR